MDHSVLLAVYLKAFEKKIDRCLTGPIMRTDVDEAETLGTCTVCLCPLLAVRIPPIGQLNNLTLLSAATSPPPVTVGQDTLSPPHPDAAECPHPWRLMDLRLER